MGSYNVHGERITQVSTLAALTLYDAGSPNTERELTDDEVLHITDMTVMTEDAGDVQVIVRTAAGGRYLIDTKTAAGVPIIIHFRTPYICDPGVVPRFSGVAQSKNMCIIQGFIREACDS